MVKLQDPTEAFTGIVAERRAARAEVDGEQFRLGAHDLTCAAEPSGGLPGVLIGASAWALKAEQVQETLQTIGRVAGDLTDWGLDVCPIGVDRSRLGSPAFVVWVCGDETQADEFEQLRRLGTAGVSIGSCVDDLTDWTFIEDVAPIGDRRFERRLLSAVTEVAPDVAERLPDLLPDSLGTGGTGGDELPQPNADNPAKNKGDGTWWHRPERGPSNS